MCGPKFYSMKTTQEVRNYATEQNIEAGMTDISHHLRVRGSGAYLKQEEAWCISPVFHPPYPVLDSTQWLTA